MTKRQPPKGTDIAEDPNDTSIPKPQRSQKAARESQHEKVPLKERQHLVLNDEPEA